MATCSVVSTAGSGTLFSCTGSTFSPEIHPPYDQVFYIFVCNHKHIQRERRFSGLTDDGKIAVASSVTAFVVGSFLFFSAGFLCGHYCQKEKKAMVPAASQCEKTTHGTPYYDDVVLNQQQELELKENVAYAPVR